MMITYERGKIEGKIEGLREAERLHFRRLLARRAQLGPVSLPRQPTLHQRSPVAHTGLSLSAPALVAGVPTPTDGCHPSRR